MEENALTSRNHLVQTQSYGMQGYETVHQFGSRTIL